MTKIPLDAPPPTVYTLRLASIFMEWQTENPTEELDEPIVGMLALRAALEWVALVIARGNLPKARATALEAVEAYFDKGAAQELLDDVLRDLPTPKGKM